MLDTIIPAVYIIILTMLAVLDFKYRIIPNKIIYPALILSLALSWFGIGMVSSLIGGAVMLAVMLVSLLFRKVMQVGMGDVKLGLLIGLMVGFPLISINMLFIGIAGIMVSVAVMIFKHRKGKDTLPFGTIMSIATILTILLGGNIWQLLVR